MFVLIKQRETFKYNLFTFVFANETRFFKKIYELIFRTIISLNFKHLDSDKQAWRKFEFIKLLENYGTF